MPWRTFMAFNFLGAALWVTVISAAGYLFGQHWEQLARDLKRLDIVVAISIFLLAIFLWRRSRRQN